MTRNRFFALLTVALASACGASPQPQTEAPLAPQTRVTAESDWQRAPNDPLAERMRESAMRLAQGGWQPSSAAARGFIVVGTAVTLPVEVPENSCVAWLSVGSTGIRDLDATLFDEDGNTVAEDVEEDAHPTIAACATDSPKRYYVVLRAYAGAGAYLMASFHGAPATLAALGQILGGKPGIASAAETENAVDGRVRLFAEGVARRSFANDSDSYRIAVSPGTWVRSNFRVETAHCYTVGAFADGDVASAQLRVLDPSGRIIARDESASLDAAAQFCAPREGSYSIEVTSARGAGGVVVASFSATEADIGGTGALWLGVRTVEDISSRSLTPVDGALHTLRAGGVGEHTVTTAPSRCSKVEVTPGAGLGRFSIEARNLRTNQLVRTQSSGSNEGAQIELCTPSEASEWRVLVSAHVGSGNYALKVTQAPE